MSVLVLAFLVSTCVGDEQQEYGVLSPINPTEKRSSRAIEEAETDSNDGEEYFGQQSNTYDEEAPLLTWKNLEVPYEFDKNLSKRARSAFRKAARLWTNFTCINITERDYEEEYEEEEGEEEDPVYYYDYSYGDGVEDGANGDEDTLDEIHVDIEVDDYIEVHGGDGCRSYVGKPPGNVGWQNITLGRKCETIGTAAHELAHALGLIHTHERPDRDQYITVNESNIENVYQNQFKTKPNRINANYTITPYDYGSVMHYGTTAGSKNRAKQTMVPKDGLYTQTLGSLLVSFYDLLTMNTLYDCTDRCKNHSSTKCKNHGFPHPRKCSECICPSGYGGQFCEERQPICGEEVNATSDWTLLVTANSSAMTYGSQDGYKKCAYWIKAPNGSHVEVRLRKLPENVAKEGCILGGVEIKAGKDQGLTGYRFCSSDDVNRTLTSNTSTLPVLTFMRRRRNDTAIELEYRIANETKEEVK